MQMTEMTTEECSALLAHTSVGRLGCSFENQPYVVPINFAYDSGYPAALTALERLTEIEREHGLPGPTGQSHKVDADGTGSPMPEAVRAEVHALDPGFADYMDLQSRMRADMSRISVRERAFATMTVDVLYQTLHESFRTHVGRALGAGATHAEVRAAVRATAPFGMTRTWRALKVLEELLAG